MNAPSDDRSLPVVIQRLVGATESLAALSLHLGHESGEFELDAPTATRVAALAAALVDLEGVDRTALRTSSAMGRAMLAQAAAFAAHPATPEAWSITDPVVLQALGRGSAAFAPMIRDLVLPDCEGLAGALGRPGAAILDVGTGVAALAVAFAQVFPGTQVVGLDVWDPALTLARANVEAAGLADRVRLRKQDVIQLDDPEAYDLVWFAGPFIPGASQPIGLDRCLQALKPGGWILYGAFAGRDPMTTALADLRTLRSGGPVLRDAEIVAMLAAAGFVDTRTVSADISIASRIVVGRRPR